MGRGKSVLKPLLLSASVAGDHHRVLLREVLCLSVEEVLSSLVQPLCEDCRLQGLHVPPAHDLRTVDLLHPDWHGLPGKVKKAVPVHRFQRHVAAQRGQKRLLRSLDARRQKRLIGHPPPPSTNRVRRLELGNGLLYRLHVQELGASRANHGLSRCFVGHFHTIRLTGSRKSHFLECHAGEGAFQDFQDAVVAILAGFLQRRARLLILA